MMLLQYLNILKRQSWIIALTLLVSITGGLIATKLMPTSYTASAMLRVQTAVEGAIGQYSSYNIFYADRLMRTYSHIASSIPVLEKVAERLGLTDLPSVDVRIVTDTELMQITISDHDPNLAAQMVNTLADVLIEHSQELYGSSSLESKILHEQLTQMEAEISTAQINRTRLLEDSDASPEQVNEAARVISVKQGIYATLLTQYQNALAEEELRMNAVSIIERAGVPTAPSRPNMVVNLVLTTLFGGTAGLGLALTAESLDSRLRSNQDIEHIAGLSILGQVPLNRTKKIRIYELGSQHHAPFRRLWFHLTALVSRSDRLSRIKGIGSVYSARLYRAGITTCRQIAEMEPEELGRAAGMPTWSANRTAQWIEQARSLASPNGKVADSWQEPYALLIASARSGEGKSLIAANIAAAAAYCEQRVLLIDADLWRPTLHNLFEQPNYPGLLEVLNEQVSIESAIQTTAVPGLDLLTSGRSLQNGELFHSFDKLNTHVIERVHDYDVIVLDSPAQLEIADAPMLARSVAAVLVVVAYGRTQQADLRALMRQLYQVNAQPIGVVINRTPPHYNSYYFDQSEADTIPSRSMTAERG